MAKKLKTPIYISVGNEYDEVANFKAVTESEAIKKLKKAIKDSERMVKYMRS